MAGASVGPVYGPIPELHASWGGGTVGGVAVSGDEVRELIRDALAISAGYRELHKLSQAMNALAATSALAVEKVISMVSSHTTMWLQVQQQYAEVQPVELPLIRADVLEYSEEPLRRGITPQKLALQGMEEEMARLAVRICRALNLTLWDLPEAPCCTNNTMRGGGARLVRS